MQFLEWGYVFRQCVLSANGKYDVKVTPLDPEGLEIKKKIVSGLQRIPEGFTEEEQLHIHDAEYIKENNLYGRWNNV